jgi:hypothetical protein
MFKALFLALAIVLAVLGGYLWYLGFFTRVQVERSQAGPYTLIGEKLTGDYGQSGKVMDDMYAWLQKQNVHGTRGFGMYFDNPRQVEKAKLRALVGNILETKDQGAVSAIAAKYAVKAFPAMDCLRAELVFKNKASVFIGIMKAYPALSAYAQAHGLEISTALEIYDIPAKKIIYLMPINPPADLARTYFEE